ncbi:MAG: hypothetical protein KGS72_27585 [Cyanobacteria bacterium REEB67]|nr:hypothetical protein [Cyanobacteria bacterium REEB67]
METNSEKASAAPEKMAAVERKLKVVVIMDVPEGPLLYCRLEDLTLTPERGSSYALNGRLFDVERAVESLNVHSRTSRRSTDEQLIELLQLLTGDPNAMVRLAHMRNIGAPEETGLAGGIILATSLSFTAGADRLLYLKLRAVSLTTQTDTMVQLARQAMEAASGGPKKGGDTSEE